MKRILLSLTLAALILPAVSNGQAWSEDFESVSTPALPTSFTSATTGGGRGWETAGASVDLYPSQPGSFIVPAHTKYALVQDDRYPFNAPANLTSTTFSMAPLGGHGYLSFDYSFYGGIYSSGQAEIAYVQFSTNGGSSYTTIDTIFGNSLSWSTQYVNLSSYSSTTCKLRFVYTDNHLTRSIDTNAVVGIALDNIKVYTPYSADLSLVSVKPISGDPSSAGSFKTSGTNAIFGGTVFNNSYNTVTSFGATYKVGAGAPVTTTITGRSIAPFTTDTFSFSTPYTVTTMGTQSAMVYVTLSGDTSHGNDTLRTSITGVASYPKKRPFFEETTGAWCGYCVRGIVYMDSIWHGHQDDVTVVAVHNQSSGRPDGMQIDNSTTISYDAYCGTKIDGFPSLIADRLFVSSVGSGVFNTYNVLSTWYGFATLTLTASVTGSTLNSSITVKPTHDLSGDYRVALIVSEDKVHGTTSNFDQHNYYNYATYGTSGGPLSGGGVDYTTAPAVIPAASMYYNFVARWTLPDFGTSPNGIASSLPTNMTSGTAYSYNFAPVTVRSNWVANKLRIIAILIDNNPNSATYGMALNSISTVGTLGVSNATAGINGLVVYPNPAQGDVTALFTLDNATNVSVNVFDMAGRVVYTGKNENLASGDHLVTIPAAQFSNGIYNVVVTSSKGTLTERFTIAK